MNEEARLAPWGTERSLYLRWRPRRFAEVVSQDAVTRTLRNAVARSQVAHAYLLCGPRGTGKTSIARILYRALNCEQPLQGEPCGMCWSCEAVDMGRAVDLIEMDAASHGGVDDVRELRERVHFAPVQARTKVYIVDEAHQLTPKAWDAFLKTLEEPPPRTMFVLATTEAHKVPPTIVSRCQRFDLRRIPQTRIREHLDAVARQEGIVVESGVAERLARVARGSLRDAIGMLEQLAAFGGPSVTMEAARMVLGLVRGDALRSFLEGLSLSDARRALQLLEDLQEEGADLRQFLDEVLACLRAALLLRAGAGSALETQWTGEEREWLTSVAHRWAPGEILALLRAYGEIETRGRDEHQVLARLELVTAWASGLRPEGGTRPAPHIAVAEPEPGSDREQAELPADPADGAAAGAPPPVALSVAVLQARWPSLLERLQGNLLARVMLGKVSPVGLEGELVTLEGPLDALEAQRLNSPDYRQPLEGLLHEEFRLSLRVRFRPSEAPAGSEAQEPGEIGQPIPELGSELFGGRLIRESMEP